ncbi:hypothetical protein ATANTOWER_005809 [Ataeniobius toweri]|uniref:Uncharacterized protein n=1 Tax=Ataeniobius toweri TaxID=208326 RepID=A0ABU7BXN1_9TELE|nr:hypothetical protein [Ataeniobius toweri]
MTRNPNEHHPSVLLRCCQTVPCYPSCLASVDCYKNGDEHDPYAGPPLYLISLVSLSHCWFLLESTQFLLLFSSCLNCCCSNLTVRVCDVFWPRPSCQVRLLPPA